MGELLEQPDVLQQRGAARTGGLDVEVVDNGGAVGMSEFGHGNGGKKKGSAERLQEGGLDVRSGSRVDGLHLKGGPAIDGAD
ncbi:hypothetical protein GCM10027081_54330 [Cupriavidus yeoncheonensis]